MIAVLGAKMYDAGDTLALEDSRVDPNFRPDQVPVTWRTDEPDLTLGREERPGTVQGAEALVTLDPDAGRVTKRRQVKSYRHPQLDERLRTERTRLEARLTSLARQEGVPTPVLSDVDATEARLELEYVASVTFASG